MFEPLNLLGNIVIAVIASHLLAKCLKDGWQYFASNLFLN